jgi:hypothetical protein
MRNDRNITVKAIIAEINNEARCDNSIKTAAFALKNNSGNTVSRLRVGRTIRIAAIAAAIRIRGRHRH